MAGDIIHYDPCEMKHCRSGNRGEAKYEIRLPNGEYRYVCKRCFEHYEEKK